KLRQREQQWQAKLEGIRAEFQGQTKELLRRREVEANAALHELESQLRKEMEKKEEATQAKARQREQELIAELSAQAEARQIAARAQWEAESEKKARAALEPFKTLLARTEHERDEARQSASDGVRKVQTLEKKLTEASTFLSTWRNGNDWAGSV